MQRRAQPPTATQRKHSSSSSNGDPPPIESESTRRRCAGQRRCAGTSAASLSFITLQLLGAALGIYLLGRLYEYGLYGSDLSDPSNAIDIINGGGSEATGVTSDADNSTSDVDATSITRTIAAAAPATTQTLFPPYMFYTAPNPTKAESRDRYKKSSTNVAKDKLYRTHCRQINPNYQVRSYDDEQCREFIAEHYPEWSSLYDALDVPVMRADMWRYLILHRFGGVYFDGDVDCKRPIDEWGQVFGINITAKDHNLDDDDPPDSSSKATNTNKIGAMVGIEYRRPARNITSSSAVYYPDRLQFVQWTMAGQPRHPIYYRTVELINETIANIRAGGTPPGDAVYITGPVMFTKAIVEFMVDKGRLTWDQVAKSPVSNDILVNDSSIVEESDLLVGDLAILHENAFAYRSTNRGVAAQNNKHETVYARHWYRGGWKPDRRKKQLTSSNLQIQNLKTKGQ